MPGVTGLMIIRTWLEPGSIKPLRVQIRLTTDISMGFEREVTLADIPAVSAAVETWLLEILALDESSSPKGQTAL
jgi:hypothetical protein